MAERINDEPPRVQLYRLLLNDKTPGVADKIKKYSFTQFENNLLNNKDAQDELGWYLESKNIVSDPIDFSERYLQGGVKTPPAPKLQPQPKVQAAPAQQFPMGIAAPAPIKEAAPSVTDIGREMAFKPSSVVGEEAFPSSQLNAFNQYGQRDLFLKEIQKTPKDQKYEAIKKNFALSPYENDDINTQIEEYGIEEVLKNIPLKVKDPRRQKTVTQTPSSIAAPVEEETYTLPPQPLVGSPEYDAQLQRQYGGMKPTLGATFPVSAVFETPEQKKQEQLSPAFKAQQLAFEDVPIASEQRKAQRRFAEAEKQQQQAAIRGGTGAELKKSRQAESEGFGDRVSANTEALWEGAKNAGINIFNGLRTVMNAAALNETPMDEDERQYYQQEEFGKMYKASKEAGENLQNELYRLNVSTDVLDAIDKGDYGKIPEATLQTIGNVGISAISSFLTAGGSMYFQTLPDSYREGVEAIARQKGITPEEVIRSGEDAKMTAQTVAGISSALERAGAGYLSKSIANKGGYKAVRDYLIRNGFGKNAGRAAGLGYAGVGEGSTEYAQQATQQLGGIAAASEDASQFFKKLPKEFFNERAAKERLSAGASGFIGGAGAVGIGRGFKRSLGTGVSLDKFSDNVVNNEIIQEAARGYEDNITKAEQQGRKPDSFNQKQLKKIANNPESWVREEIKYIRQTIESNKTLGLDSKVEENSLAKATSLLNQIKAEKKAIEQADIASSEVPVAPEASVVPEAPVAPVVAPEESLTEEQKTVLGNLEEERRQELIYNSQAHDDSEAQSRADQRTNKKFDRLREEVVLGVPPVTEEVPVAPETEDELSFLEEMRLTPEEETAPAAPSMQFKLPTLNLPRQEGFAPSLRKLGYTDEEISSMTLEQQQDIVINKTEPARAESSSKVDVEKENQRLEKVADAQRKLDEDIAATEASLAKEEVVAAAPVTPAAPKAEPAKTNEEQIAILRAEEQAELDSRIKGADKYRGPDGKVDKTKLTKKADIKAFDEVYDKYDKLISPLMETKPAETTAQAEFTSKQESSASTEFDGTKKPSKIKTKSFDNKHGKGAFERMKNITDNFEDIMDGLSGKIKQDCL